MSDFDFDDFMKKLRRGMEWKSIDSTEVILALMEAFNNLSTTVEITVRTTKQISEVIEIMNQRISNLEHNIKNLRKTVRMK